MMDFTIKEIAEACGGKLVLQGEKADADRCVSSVAIDSRKAEEGGVFLATIGERADGHKFIPSVFAKGGALAVTQKPPEQVEAEHGCPAAQWGSYLLVEDTLQALESMAEAYRKKLSIKVVGITGSSGKTSVKEFIASVLGEKYCVLKTEGNLNNEIGVPLTLLSIRKEHQAAVVEMGISDFGEMHRLSKMARPDICLITNIGQSHLKDLKTRDGILKAKCEIFDFMAEDGEICFNGEDDKLSALKEVKGHKPHFFGLGGNPAEEVIAGEISGKGLWGSVVTFTIKDREDLQQFTAHVPLPGAHMVLNAAAAVCVARLFGLKPEEIVAGLAKVTPVDGRTHIIPLPRYTLIDDCYNANPASMEAAIDLLAMADTEKVAILGDMFNLGEDSHKLHGRIGSYAAAAGIEHIICVGEESLYMYQEAADSIGKPVEADVAQPVNFGNVQVSYYPDRKALMDALSADNSELVPTGSTVLVKASHGMEFKEVLDFLQRYTADCKDLQ